MKFSIIVPIYKVEEYLSQCVESILVQTYMDFELILVDDGSPDGCPEICDRYAVADNRVKVIHKSNGGLSDARNAGINAAQGDYLAFLDSDDYWNSADVLSKIADAIRDVSYDVVQFGIQKLYPDKEEPDVFVNQSIYEETSESDEYLHCAVCEKRLSISACSMVVSRAFLQQNDLLFVKGIKSEDIEWGIRLFAQKPNVLFIGEAFYVYRQFRKGSITSGFNEKHMEDYCNIIESSVTLIESKHDSTLNSLMSYIMYHVSIATAHCKNIKLTVKQRRNFNKRLRKVAKNRITKYNEDPRVKMILPFYSFGGFELMSFVLGVYLKWRRR